MGNSYSFFSSLSSIWDSFRGPRKMRILMLGLDAAGKTTILYKLKLDESVMTVPTIGFNVEVIVHKNIEMTIWDVGGQHLIRRLWEHYYNGTEGLIWVLDSTDKERMKEARDELFNLINPSSTLNGIPVLVFANKQDMSGALDAEKVGHELGFADGINGQHYRNANYGRSWYVQECVGTTGEGLLEGLEQFSRMMQNYQSNSRPATA